MAQIKFYSGLDNSIKSKPIENGAIYLSTDSNKPNKFYVDLNGIRHEVGDMPIGNLTTAGAVNAIAGLNTMAYEDKSNYLTKDKLVWQTF